MTLDDVVLALQSRECDPHQTAAGWTARCPLHDSDPPEMHFHQDGGVIAFDCPAKCQGRRILAAIGVDAPKIKPRVLAPGAHGHIERGSDVFTDEVLSALPPKALYRRGDEVGRVTGIQGEQAFKPLNAESIRLLADEFVAIETTKEARKQQELVYTPCTKDHATLIKEAAQKHKNVSVLTQIVRHPVLLPNGELSPPGLHPSGVFYDQPERLQNLKPNLDRSQAVELLVDSLIDFPFFHESDFWNFVGLLLTPIIRPCVVNTPIHLIHATKPRTGKSLLAETFLGTVLYGQPIAITTLPEDEGERQKKIFGFLREGRAFMNLDNVADFIDSPSIAALLTASAVEDRPMREHQIVSVPNRLCVVMTGNHVKATEEIVERCVPVLLQSELEDPSARTTFQHPDLHGYLAAQSTKLLEALLGLVVLWHRKGRPPGAKHHMGGFDAWAAVIGGVLEQTPWLDNARRWRREANPHREDLASFIRLWHAEAQEFPRSASDLSLIAQRANLFPACFKSQSQHGCVQSFVAKVLKPSRDSNVGGYFVRRHGSDSAASWLLESAATL